MRKIRREHTEKAVGRQKEQQKKISASQNTPETVTVHLGGSMNSNAKIPDGMSYDDNSYTRLLKEDLNIEVAYDWVASSTDYDEK